MLALIAWAALINWLVTTIFVESKLFEPVRNWVIMEAYYVRWTDGTWRKCGGRHGPVIFPEEHKDEPEMVMRGPWLKAAQLVTCQLCTRVWVGFAEAAYFGGPDHGWARLIANGLLYAGAGHLIFELRSRVALVLPEKT